MKQFTVCHRFAVPRLAKHQLPWVAILATAPMALGQQGSISGAVCDPSGSAIAHAQVRLSLEGQPPDREMQSADSGEFSFRNVDAGPYRLTFSSPGFASKTITGELHAGEALSLPRATLAIDTLATEVNVTQTQAELAEAQIKVAEQQRLLGVLPNFFAVYDRDAAPLNAKQKLELTART